MKLLVLLAFGLILCEQCNSTSHTTSTLVSSKANPVNPWDGIWNYGFNDGGLNLRRDGSVSFAENLSESDAGVGNHHSAGNAYQTNSGIPGSSHYVQNQVGAEAYSYIHPAASASQGYYSPGGLSSGWNSGKPSTETDLHKGLEQIFEGIQFDKAALGTLASILGVSGIKGTFALIKLGFFFLFVAVPLLLFITVPLSALLVIIILSIPIPTWPNKGGRSLYRSLANTSEILLAERVIFADECLERLGCNLAQMTKQYGQESLVSRIKRKIKAWKNTWSERIIRGAENDNSSCDKFQCSPTKILKNVSNNSVL
ncbi:unnamed protein product [Allacma fusca]|uniref:Uncharacterized protein n=1 Tax=Allacma fusca TaxID=39272 RepID=A0A8J2PJF6_9HEXA|nr:unnamed protein product [Allacma fusca]